jgi:hypothetical protein
MGQIPSMGSFVMGLSAIRWRSRAYPSVFMLVVPAQLLAQDVSGYEPSFWSSISPVTVVIVVLLGVAACILFFNYRHHKSKGELKDLGKRLSIAPEPAIPERKETPRASAEINTPPSVPAAVSPPVSVPPPVAPGNKPEEAPTSASAPQAPRSIFISYRRQDSQHITGRLYDRLISQFGKEAVFKDVDSIPLGYDFRDHLREQVGRCAVLVAVIGKSWNPPAASGDRRLSDPRDHLRIEIESALERRIPVIPVLVDGVEVPAEEELPASLGRLAYHNGVAVRPDPDFHHDADRLVRGIDALFRQTPR